MVLVQQSRQIVYRQSKPGSTSESEDSPVRKRRTDSSRRAAAPSSSSESSDEDEAAASGAKSVRHTPRRAQGN